MHIERSINRENTIFVGSIKASQSSYYYIFGRNEYRLMLSSIFLTLLSVISLIIIFWPTPTEINMANSKINELIKNESLEEGLIHGKLSSRGVTTRHPYAGGDLERELADSYEKDSVSLQLIYPRTARILSKLASHYRSDAKYHDQKVDLQ